MSRLIAFGFLAWAAFDWPAWVLDRAGLALMGLAFLALSAGRKMKMPWARAIPPSAPSTLEDAAQAWGAAVGATDWDALRVNEEANVRRMAEALGIPVEGEDLRRGGTGD